MLLAGGLAGAAWFANVCVVPVAAPMLGVVSVGLVARTTAPDPVVPLLKSAAAGCEAAGTPEVEIELIHSCETAANDCTPPSVDALGLGHRYPVAVPLMSANDGCDAAGTPVVEMELIH